MTSCTGFSKLYQDKLIERLDEEAWGGEEEVYQLFCGFCLSGPMQSSIYVLVLSPVIRVLIHPLALDF